MDDPSLSPCKASCSNDRVFVFRSVWVFGTGRVGVVILGFASIEYNKLYPRIILRLSK